MVETNLNNKDYLEDEACVWSYMRLAVVLQWHSHNVHTDDEGDEDVQVVTSAQSVDHQSHMTVTGIVGQLLGLWEKWVDQFKMSKHTFWQQIFKVEVCIFNKWNSNIDQSNIIIIPSPNLCH